MSDFKFIVDTDKLNRQLMEHRMTTQESRRAIRNGLAAAGRIIRNAARDNLSNVSGKNGKINSSPLLRFVKFKVYRDCGGVRIDILGELQRGNVHLCQRKVLKIWHLRLNSLN